ncbi:SusD/RagB family nutrient-binding outer membrane lipoprotein [Bacteroides ovatus]|nr:SusD/RagB family nutrient-binding outer membrane lipoprotein [Bacteroides ovatus]
MEELIAADQLLSTTGGTVEGDLIYGNDITRWKQFTTPYGYVSPLN